MEGDTDGGIEGGGGGEGTAGVGVEAEVEADITVGVEVGVIGAEAGVETDEAGVVGGAGIETGVAVAMTVEAAAVIVTTEAAVGAVREAAAGRETEVETVIGAGVEMMKGVAAGIEVGGAGVTVGTGGKVTLATLIEVEIIRETSLGTETSLEIRAHILKTKGDLVVIDLEIGMATGRKKMTKLKPNHETKVKAHLKTPPLKTKMQKIGRVPDQMITDPERNMMNRKKRT